VATDDRGKPADVADAADAAQGARDDVAEDAAGDDYEPYLPPGPNPFSSVHPQGTPSPYPPFGGSEPPSPPPVSPYPPLPDDELNGGRPAQPGYGGAAPYPTYTPYGPDDEVADDALTDYGLPSPQSYGYAPPPPLAEPLPDLGVPEPRFGSPAPASPPSGGPPASGPPASGPPAGGPPPETPPPAGPPAPAAPAYRNGGPPDHDYRDNGFPGDGPAAGDNGHRNELGPLLDGHPDDEDAPPPEPGDRLVAGHRRGPGAPGLHRAAPADAGSLRGDGDAALRGAPPPTGPARNPAAAPPLRPPAAGPLSPPAAAPRERPVAPERPQPGYPPAGPPPGGAPRGPVPGANGPAGPPRPGLDDEEYGPDPNAGSGRETADSLTAEALLQGKRTAPGSGWRRTVYRATGGLVRVGESAGMQRRRELVWRARTPVAGGHHRVAVMSLKGGVGKTTTTVGLGATLGTLRGDRVIAVDANPDRGTLSDKVRLETSATVRDLLNERQQVHRYADVRAFTSQASSRLEVLASDRDPGVSVAFSDADYRDVARVLEHYYSICITDCGTGLLHSAMGGVLALADQIVLVSSPSVDGARSASATLDWLDAHDYSDLVRNAVVVLSTVRPRSKSTVDLDRLEQHFAARCRDVVRVPYDPHLEEGAEVELEQLSAATTEAYLQLAATVGDGFAWPRRTVNRGASA
jgi:MinD-like ATPase involved in chromosome partitioning or flagellar assembly